MFHRMNKNVSRVNGSTDQEILNFIQPCEPVILKYHRVNFISPVRHQYALTSSASSSMFCIPYVVPGTVHYQINF